MNVRQLLILLILTPLIFFGCETREQLATHAEVAAPDATKVLLTNDYISVYTITLEPGAQMPAFEAGRLILYALSANQIEFETEDGNMTRDIPSGNVHYYDHESLAATNVDESQARYLVVERENLPFPAVEDRAEYALDDMAVVEGEELFQNDEMIVWTADLRPGEVIAPHGGPARVIYASTPCVLEGIGPGSESEQMLVFEEGGVGFRRQPLFALENAGVERASLLLVDYKR